MLDVTEQLRRYGDAVTATVDAVPAPEAGAVAVQPSRPRRPVWQPLVAVAAAVALLAGGLWLVNGSSDDPASEPDLATGPRDGIELLEAWPLEPRADAAVVWTGEELVVWGGDVEAQNLGLGESDRAFGDGAAYNPATRKWRTMSASPLPTNMDGVTSVSTDQGVVIARGTSVALWDPKTDTWRRLDDPPGSIGAPGSVPDLTFTGRDVLSVRANATLDLDTGRWQSLPKPPVKLQSAVPVWTGRELVVLGEQVLTVPGGSIFDPATRTWRELDVPRRLRGNALGADWDGERVVVVDYEMRVADYTPETGTWQTLPSVPARFSEGYAQPTAVPPALVVRTATALVIRMNELWTPLPYGELDFGGWWVPVAPAGTARDRATIFVFGLTPSGENRLALVDPVRLVESARTLQVGVATVNLPPDVELTGSDADGPQLGPDDQAWVRVELSAPAGSCTVTNTKGDSRQALRRSNNAAVERYTSELEHLAGVRSLEARVKALGQQLIAAQRAGSDELAALVSQRDAAKRQIDDATQQTAALQEAGPERPAVPGEFAPTDATGTMWSAQATATDVVRVRCPDRATAKRIVDATSLPPATR